MHADRPYLHEFLSWHTRAQELHQVPKLAALELFIKLDNELQILGAKA